MQLFKKIAFYTFIAITLSMAVWGYFKLKESKAPSISVTEHIDKNISCLVISQNIQELINQLTRQNLIWNSIKTDNSFNSINQSIHALDSLFKTDTEFANLFNNNALYSCFFETEKNNRYLFILKAKEKSNQSVVQSFFETKAKTLTIANAELSYELRLNKKHYYIAYYKGLIYFALNKQDIEQSIQLPTKNAIAFDEEFNRLLKANGSQNNLLYINKNNQSLFSALPLLNKALYQSVIKPDNITLNGYAVISQLGNLFQNQNACIIDAYEELPQKPSSMVGISLSNAHTYYQQYEKLCNQQELDVLNKSWKLLADTLLYNIQKEFLENINNQIVTAYYPNTNEVNKITAIALNDAEKMTELLKVANDSTFSINENRVYQLAKEHQTIFSFIQSSDRNKYAIISNDLLILCNNKSALQFYIRQYESNLLIRKDKEMLNYTEDNFSEACHILQYNNQSLLSSPLSEPVILNQASVIAKQQSLSKIAYTAKMLPTHWQVRISAHCAKSSTNTNTEFENNNLWEYESDSSIVTSPYLFTNHLTQENELCFQTNNKELHLLNSVGNLIWSKKINEAIQSNIYTVDIFKNGKLQLLFNTENYIHLIDRNGNYVQGYPIKTPSKITSSISLLDYDNDKNYRLLIACADKHIYNYSVFGVKTEGFSAFKTNNVVTLPIKYVKVGLSDYLIAIDNEGKIYGISRKGEGRFSLNNHTTINLPNFEVIAGNTINNTKIVYIDDTDNLLNKISLTDKKETLKLGDEILNYQFQFDLVNDDLQMDVVCYGDGALYGYDLFSNKLVEYFSATSVYTHVQIAKTSSNIYIIAYDKASNKIDVLSSSGKLKYSLPYASKPALISNLYKNGTLYIIYTYNNKLMCKALK